MLRVISLIFILTLAFFEYGHAQPLPSAIKSIGCKNIAATKSVPAVFSESEYSQWLRTEFKVIETKSYIAKCDVSGSYYRFLFEVQTFDSLTDAEHRLANLSRLPKNENSKFDFALPKILGDGFVKGKSLYTVGAYASFLEDSGYVRKLRDRLKKQIK